AHAGSAALGELAKPLAYERGRAAIAAQLERLGLAGTVERLPEAGRYRVRYARPEPVTVVAPTASDGTPPELRARLRDGDALVELTGGVAFAPALARYAAGLPADRT